MNNETTIHANKLRLIVTILVIGFIAVGVFLFRWQIIDAKKYEEMASERIRNEKIPALRGSIYSGDGSTLAYDERRFDVFAYTKELERAEKYGKQTRQEYISKVSRVLGLEESKLKEIIDSGPLWVQIASKLPQEKKEELLDIRRDNEPDFRIEGNFIEFTSQRIYPENSLASHLIGFYGDNGSGQLEGRAGIERYWEGSLKSIEGYQVQQVDSFENTIPIIDFKPIEEQRGSDIYLTIDTQIQKIIEKNLAEAVKKHGASSGAIVVMDPKTGKVIGLANYPTYDPNKYNKVENGEAFNNRAVSVPYEFGSVGKVFTFAGAIEDGLLTPDTMMMPNGHQGCYFYKDREDNECKIDINFCRVCTYNKKPVGPMTAADGLVSSDNVVLYQIAKRMKPEGLHKYLENFGMGKPTGVEIYESYSYLKEPEEWLLSDLVTYSYGHGYQGTLLQIVSGVSAIANDGVIMQPYIVSKIKEADGVEKAFQPIAISKPVSKETSDTVANVMNKVYKNNLLEGYNKDLLAYPIGMKSGTALIPYKDRAGYSDEINATYVGFDYSDEKTFVMGVWLEKPNGALSSTNARPLWIDTFRDIKDLLHVPKK